MEKRRRSKVNGLLMRLVILRFFSSPVIGPIKKPCTMLCIRCGSPGARVGTACRNVERKGILASGVAAGTCNRGLLSCCWRGGWKVSFVIPGTIRTTTRFMACRLVTLSQEGGAASPVRCNVSSLMSYDRNKCSISATRRIRLPDWPTHGDGNEITLLHILHVECEARRL
jgi:hypothetical protein